MDILLKDTGKKYFKEWIFRHLDYHFLSGKAFAITGPNGSGKSTLLKTISGHIPVTEGEIQYKEGDKTIDTDLWPHLIAYAAPYLEVIEEFTLLELLQFHFSFKRTWFPSDSVKDIAERMYLQDALNKQVKNFSSGMKQRLKLGLAIFSETPVLLLDEPTSNMDVKGIDWYLEQIEKTKKGRIILICSNQEHEYQFCDLRLDITLFKKGNIPKL